MLATLLQNLGQVAHRQGNLQDARTLYDESLSTAHELGDPWMVASTLGGLAGLAASTRRPDEARTAALLSGAMEATLEATGARLDPLDLRDYEANVSAARTALGEGAWQAAWVEGHAVTLEEAVELGRHAAYELEREPLVEQIVDGATPAEARCAGSGRLQRPSAAPCGVA